MAPHHEYWQCRKLLATGNMNLAAYLRFLIGSSQCFRGIIGVAGVWQSIPMPLFIPNLSHPSAPHHLSDCPRVQSCCNTSMS